MINKYLVEPSFTQKLFRPLGELRYVCKTKVYMSLNGGQKVVYETSQCWGKTEEEAAKKSQEAANEWIKKNTSK